MLCRIGQVSDRKTKEAFRQPGLARFETQDRKITLYSIRHCLCLKILHAAQHCFAQRVFAHTGEDRRILPIRAGIAGTHSADLGLDHDIARDGRGRHIQLNRLALILVQMQRPARLAIGIDAGRRYRAQEGHTRWQYACYLQIDGLSLVLDLRGDRYIAMAQGQKIYTINQSNLAASLPQLKVGSAVVAEIQSAVNSGKEVTVHEATVNIDGWQGAGYVIADPDTGAAAYKIGSGENGGLFASAIMGVTAMYLISNSIGAPIVAALLISVALHIAILALTELISEGSLDPIDIFKGSAAALSLLRAISTLFAGIGIAGFTVPGGIAMGIVLIALAILGFSKIGQ